MEKKADDDKKMRTIRMTDAEWRRIRLAAALRDTSASDLIRAVMRDFLDNGKKVKNRA